MAKAAMTEMEEAKNKTEEEGGRRRREVVRWRGGGESNLFDQVGV